MKIVYTLFAIFIILGTGCKTDKNTNSDTSEPTVSVQIDTAKARALPHWASQANIYEVNIRQYTPEGTFVAFSKHLPRLRAMGVKILWFMPIFPISETKKKGSLGSYYAVTDFKKTNPEFGTIEEFQNVIDQAHQLGIKVILDWVPNHTGWDHIWLKSNPEFYTQDENGNVVDPIDPSTGESWGWTDVADLNFDNQEMRKEMINDMLFWINNYAIDGFRMDVAHNVPNDFWKQATDQLYAANDSIFMLAESETTDHLNEGYFHAIYGWGMHHLLNDIAKGNRTASAIDSLLLEKKGAIGQGMYMNFISNHDENSWAGTIEERMGDGADAFAVLAATFDGIPLIYGGQEEPLKKRLEFFEKDDIGFKKYEKQKFFKTLLSLKSRNKALGNGSFSSPIIKVGDSDHIYAFMKEKDGDKIAVMVNLSNEKQQIRLSKAVTGLTNIFNGRQVEMGPGTIKSFDPWEYWVASNR
ncbi:MAG: alpha-amylase family glycosyl hydrolase [Saprospiraceae bacterium]|nr:alpha-amylase family glycosyl hydrolase [Saprospiraceae bacterium]